MLLLPRLRAPIAAAAAAASAVVVRPYRGCWSAAATIVAGRRRATAIPPLPLSPQCRYVYCCKWLPHPPLALSAATAAVATHQFCSCWYCCHRCYCCCCLPLPPLLPPLPQLRAVVAVPCRCRASGILRTFAIFATSLTVTCQGRMWPSKKEKVRSARHSKLYIHASTAPVSFAPQQKRHFCMSARWKSSEATCWLQAFGHLQV